MKWIWYFIVSVIVILGLYAIYAVYDSVTKSSKDSTDALSKLKEKAYFEGQRDALDGDIRIRKVNHKMYVWLRSPYNDSTKPFADTIVVYGEYK